MKRIQEKWASPSTSWLGNGYGTSQPPPGKLYIRYFSQFGQFTQLDPDEILALAKKDQKRLRDHALQFYEKLVTPL